jgi:hypothetical protein
MEESPTVFLVSCHIEVFDTKGMNCLKIIELDYESWSYCRGGMAPIFLKPRNYMQVSA